VPVVDADGRELGHATVVSAEVDPDGAGATWTVDLGGAPAPQPGHLPAISFGFQAPDAPPGIAAGEADGE
jgi:hypothetical protein